jgi:hypothetical protein
LKTNAQVGKLINNTIRWNGNILRIKEDKKSTMFLSMKIKKKRSRQKHRSKLKTAV